MRLLLGISYEDKRYFDFGVRLLTLGGECAALEKVAELGLDEKENLTKAEQMLVDLAYLSEQLDIIGLAQDKLTPQFLLDNLATDDYVLITQLSQNCEKSTSTLGKTRAKPKPNKTTLRCV